MRKPAATHLHRSFAGQNRTVCLGSFYDSRIAHWGHEPAAFDVFVPGRAVGREIAFGRIIHGDVHVDETRANI